MNARMFSVAACAAAWGLLVSNSCAAGIPVVVEGGGDGRHLSASAQVRGAAVAVRVSHRSPGGAREPGVHLHVRVVTGDSRLDIFRGIPPRSPRSRMRQSRDQVLVTVPGARVREVRVTCVPGPHAGCRGWRDQGDFR